MGAYEAGPDFRHLLEVPEDRPLSVQEAFMVRDLYVDVLERCATSVVSEYNRGAGLRRSAGFSDLTLESFLRLVKLLKNAHLVYWRSELWEAALVGHEVFRSEKANSEELMPPAQFWLPNRDFHFNPSEAETDLGLEPGVVNMCGLLMVRSYIGNDPKQIRGLAIYSLVGRRPLSPEERDLAMRDSDFLMRYIRDNYLRIRCSFIPDGELIEDDAMARIFALIHFMNLPIVEIQTHRPPRAERRRLEHEKKRVPDIHVIALRRVRHAQSSSGERVDWSCHWVVSGHWRKQWHPSTHTHAPAYIHAYVKGDTSKPFKPPTKSIYAVVR